MPITIADLKQALRLLVKRPWLTALTIVVLAGGLGISLYTFAALNALIYRDLPLPDGGSIVRIGVGEWPNVAPLEIYEIARIRAEAETLREVGVFRTTRALIGEPGASRNVRSIEADWRIIEFTRTPPLLGRGFVGDDAEEGGEAVAVLSYETWQAAFAGDPDVVGETVRIDAEPVRIVGVMPEGYGFPNNGQIWRPLARQEIDPTGYTDSTLAAYARLAPAVETRAAEAELTALLARVRQERAAAGVETGESSRDAVSVMSFQEESFGVFGTIVFGVLNLLAIAILLLAAVNVGNLLLARTNERIQEVGVRVALGAPRWRLIAQTMLENIMLCAIGGALAIWLAARGLAASNDFMRALVGGDLPFWWTWRLDRDVAVAAGVFLVVTMIVVSVLPAFCVSRVDANSLLREGTRAGRGLGTGRISRALVTIQVALISSVMVVGGVAINIAQRAASFDIGISTSAVLTTDIAPPAESYATAEARLSLYEDLLAELRAEPGIDAAVIMQQVGPAYFGADDREYASPDARPRVMVSVLSETPTPIGPTLLQGRAFDTRDGATGLRTAIVSETLARIEWPNESPLGRRIVVAFGGAESEGEAEGEAETRVVVGVMSDRDYDPLGIARVGRDSREAIYLPLPQASLPNVTIIYRHRGDEAHARSAWYEALRRVDPALPPGNLVTLDVALEQMTLFARTMTRLFAGCGIFAIVLAISGIYGMSGNAVVLRRAEIGLRRALGASNGRIIAVFLAQSGRQLAIGLALSALLSAGLLVVVAIGFDVKAGTLASIGFSVVAAVASSVLLSVYLSVRGVLRLEPSAALRHT